MTSQHIRHAKIAAMALTSALALHAAPAAAQSFTPIKPGTNYFDLKLGTSDFDVNCGNIYRCNTSDTSYGLVFGQQVTRNYGWEFGYQDFGTAQRGGGDTSAQAFGLSFVGTLPLDNRFALFGKVGLNYGMTSTNTPTFSDIRSGDKSAIAPTLGLGASFDLTPNMAIVGQWEHNSLKFVDSTDSVTNTSIGLRLKF